MAVRRVDGAIAVRSHPDTRGRSSLWERPLLRGLRAIGIALPLGLRALSEAVSLRSGSTERPRGWSARAHGVATIASALAFAFALFGFVPAWVGSHAPAHGPLAHAVEPLARVVMFLAYLAAVGRLREVKRVFAYHGAEHQVVAAHEFGVAVDATVARNFSRFHPRCGTTFVVLVAVLEGVLHALVPLPTGAATRAIELPLAVMLSYELLQLATGHCDRWWARALLAPGKALQRLTTGPPDQSQLEVACAALHAVLSLAPSEDQDEQQDDEDQNQDSPADVHVASSRSVRRSVSSRPPSETTPLR
jgi:uncharacterized protein YqhQ